MTNKTHKTHKGFKALTDKSPVEKAIELIVTYKDVPTLEGKDWLLDQVVRELAGSDYETVVRNNMPWREGEDPREAWYDN